MTLKIIPIIFRDEIPSKNINFKSFRADQFCLENFFSIFYSKPRAFR